MNIEKILDEAIKLNASDVHLICNNKPMVRIAKDLIPIKNSETITPEDMSEIYDKKIKFMSCRSEWDSNPRGIFLCLTDFESASL